MRSSRMANRGILLCVLLASAFWVLISGCQREMKERVVIEESRVGGEEARPGAKGRTIVKKVYVYREERPRNGPRWQALERGIQAYHRGDYSAAYEMLQALSRKGGEKDFQREVLYAMACARLAMARELSGLQEGLILWNRWKEAARASMPGEDPRLIDPVLQHYREMLQTERERVEKLERYREQGKLLEEKEREIKRLRDQLEALERIHREIDRKKKGVVSP